MPRRDARGKRSEYEGRMSQDKLQGSTIVVTGVTGQVARPLATALARENRVIGAARFSDTAARAELEAAGVECVPVDLVSGDMGKLPEDADYVLHFAVAKTNDWEKDLAANSGGLAYLMEHHRRRPRLPALLVHGGLQAGGAPRLRRGGAARRQPRRVAVPADVQHLQNRGGGHGPLGRRALRASHDHCAVVRALRRQRWLACDPPAHDAVRPRHPRPRGCPERLPPTACRRHPGHGAAPARRGVGPGRDRQLGRQRAGQH